MPRITAGVFLGTLQGGARLSVRGTGMHHLEERKRVRLGRCGW